MKWIITSFLTFLTFQLSFATNIEYPTRNIEESENGFIVTYSFPEINPSPSAYFDGTYVWNIPGFGMNDEQGEPAIPLRQDVFAIPNGKTPRIQILESEYTTTSGMPMSPSYPIVPADDSEYTLTGINSYHGYFPSTIIKKEQQEQYNGIELITIKTMPIQYNYELQETRIFSKIKYKVSFENSLRFEETQDQRDANRQKIDHTILRNIVCNPQIFNSHIRQISTNETISTPIFNGYLIITVPQYIDRLHDFIEWKKTKGHNVFVESMPRGSWTPSDVIQLVTYYFNNYNIKHLLIVGNNQDIPGITMSVYNNYYRCTSDYYYGLPFANAGISKVYDGRIPIDNGNELTTILNKIISYESTPPTESVFYNTGAHSAYFQDIDDSLGEEDRAFVLTSEEVRNHIQNNYNKTIYRNYYASSYTNPMYWNSYPYGYGQTIPSELQRPQFEWNGNDTIMSNLINSGCLYVLHRDHGDEYSWSHPAFNTTNIAQLANGNKQPVIFSICCRTGNYTYGDNCFAESFLKKENGGCVGIFAATNTSFSGYNEPLTFGMFDALWPGLSLGYGLRNYNNYTHIDTPLYELGEVLDAGLFRLKETWGAVNGNSAFSNYTSCLFHCFGDPSMRMYTQVPNNFHQPSMCFSNDSIYVYTDEICDINIYNKTRNTVHAFKGNQAVVPVSTNDHISVCLDKPNYVPYLWDTENDVFIQNETISDQRAFIGSNIYIGTNVTDQKPEGPVVFDNSDVHISGTMLKIDKGTTIKNASFFKYIAK